MLISWKAAVGTILADEMESIVMLACGVRMHRAATCNLVLPFDLGACTQRSTNDNCMLFIYPTECSNLFSISLQAH